MVGQTLGHYRVLDRLGAEYFMRTILLAGMIRLGVAQEQPQLVWEGDVDGVSILYVRRDRLQVEDKQGLPVQRQRFRFYDSLPARRQDVEIEAVEGRGRVRIYQQPGPENQYTLAVLIEDPPAGSGFYSLRAYWAAAGGFFGGSRVEPPRRPAYDSGRGERLTWSGRIDGEVIVSCRGDSCEPELVRGQPVVRDRFQFSRPLPAQEVAVSLEETGGRGEIRLVEQPAERNGYTAKVLIRDSQGGAGDYSFTLAWARPSRADSTPLYARRGLVWSGRVDGRVRVIVEGNQARAEVLAGAPVDTGRTDFDRPLPNRPSPNATVRRLRGRGGVEIVEYPSQRNGYRLVFEIADTRGGADDYVVEVAW